MRKSPGFDEGHWPLLLNECPWFCATCIGETFRSCMMQRSQKNHTVLSLGKFFKSEKNHQRFSKSFSGRYIESDLRKVMLEWAKLF